MVRKMVKVVVQFIHIPRQTIFHLLQLNGYRRAPATRDFMK